MKSKTYRINEIFFSRQGEGKRTGTENVFVRFSGCNLHCLKEVEGFDCDTEFVSGRDLRLEELIKEIHEENQGRCNWVILTGGEPTLQMDDALLDRLHAENFQIAIETNGTAPVSEKVNWICVSPKTAEHSIRQKKAHEVKYVRAYGMGIPKTLVQAEHYLISPAFEAQNLPEKNLQWCLKLIAENPLWELSIQKHKIWNIR